MGVYVTESCPNCGHKFTNFKRKYVAIGNPYKKCPKCKTIVKFDNINEWPLMSKWRKLKFLIATLFDFFVLNIMVYIPLLIVFVIFNSFFKSYFLQDNLFLVIGAIHLLLFPFITYLFLKTFFGEINDSKKRMEDKEYASLIFLRNKILEEKKKKEEDDNDIIYI